jgi:lysophospholipase L1-like esterase
MILNPFIRHAPWLAAFALGIMATTADIVLYSSSFGGSSATNLNGQAVVTSGASGAQHTQYGTNASATWSAAAAFKADGSFVESGAFNSNANRVSATLVFTPQDGYVYHLTMTTSFTQLPNAAEAAWHAVGYFETSGFTGNINSATGADVWALTRPGDPGFDDQVAHYNVTGGAGNKNAIPTTVEDETAPSTLRITLDTTGGNGNWAATYHVADGSGGFTQLASVADLNAVTIGSVGIGVFNADGTARFQSFELSVVAQDLTAPLRIMPMGDSITVGYTNADWTGGAFEFGYRSGLYTLLSNAGYSFRFVGNSTEPWTFRDPLTTDPAWPPALNLAAIGQDGNNGYAGKTASFLNTGISSWLASQDPNIILLKIGTNSQDQPGLQTLVNTITTTKPDCHLIIAQIMPKYTYQQGIVDYNTWIRDTLVPAQQALGRKVTVVDQYAPFLSNPTDLTSIDQALFSNEINHPSNPGYDKMAQVWFDAIEALGLGPNTFSNWIGGFDGLGGQTDLIDDPDGDGIKNGIENFFGTAPDAFSPGIAIGTVDSVQGTFTFSHPQGVLADDLAATYQWSKDLQTFHGNLATDAGDTTVGFTIQADTPEPGTTTVTATVTGTPCDRLFLRVDVTEN